MSMKFDRSKIMKAAWRKFNHFDLTFSQALRLAWAEARMAAARYNVFGQCIGSEAVLIASGVNGDRAGELEWFHKCSFDRIWTVMVA